jgi:hypothetical protein
MFTVMAVVSGFVLLVVERNPRVHADGTEIASSIDDMVTALWVVIVTASTVGYGDFYPVTHIGRVVGFLMAILGNFFIGLIIVAAYSSLTYSR